MTDNTIAVIIPAYNASATIARAVISALRESEVSEVIVVDDGSTDDTIAQAIGAADGSKRLRVIALTRNNGPSAARNRAIRESTAPWIAILDADDFFMPGRFKPLLALADSADFIADDMWQVSEESIGAFKKSLFGDSLTEPHKVAFAEFVLSNISRPKFERRELGFVKPIMRRQFLDNHQLHYQEALRLGEDYEFYARALANGARLWLLPNRGYVSVIRKESLSGAHTIEDLRRMRDCNDSLAALPGLTESDREALRKHYLGVDCRLQWRLLIQAVKQMNLKDAFATFLHPFPVPYYLMTKLAESYIDRTRKLLGIARGERDRKPDPIWPLAAGFVSLIFLLAAQKQALLDLWRSWHTEEYSHGVVVVIIAVLFALHRLQESKPLLKPSWLGLPILLLAGSLQLVARLAAFDTAAEYGIIIGLTGLSLAFMGRQATRALLPALIYLIFAVPLPHLFQADLSQKLQLLSSRLGVLPLDWLDIPVFQEGNIIDLGGFRLQVVEACNGLRYLFPLMSFGYLVAMLYEGSFWKRTVIFLSTIPIAIGLNALRIALIGITVDHWGRSMAEGFLHGFEGWSVFLLCLLFLLLEVYMLEGIGHPGRFRYDFLNFPRRSMASGFIQRSGPMALALTLVAASAFAFSASRFERTAEIHPPHAAFTTFPLKLGDWNGRPSNLAPETLNALQLSDYWLADYAPDSGGGSSVNLYIAYYDSQRIGATTHSPSNCIPGGGWQIDNSTIKTLALADGDPLEFTQLLIKRGNDAELVDYWFQERGRDLTETTVAKWYLLEDSLMMHRTDGALVRLVTPLAPGEPPSAAEERLNDFLRAAYPSITAFIPN